MDPVFGGSNPPAPTTPHASATSAGIHRSDPIPLGPIAWRRDLPESTKAGLRQSFLGMRDVTFGTLGELTHFVEVSDRTYDVVRETATILKLDLKKMDD